MPFPDRKQGPGMSLFTLYWLLSSFFIPQRLAYKIHVLVRVSPISMIFDWSYIKGGLIAQFRHTNATYPYFVLVLDFSCIALTLFNYRNLNDKMPKSGPKPKAITQPCWNLYKYRLGPFLRDSEAFLRTAKAQGPDCDTIDDTRRWSWTCEQKLGAVKYALLKVVLNKAGKEKLISNNAAAINVKIYGEPLQK